MGSSQIERICNITHVQPIKTWAGQMGLADFATPNQKQKSNSSKSNIKIQKTRTIWGPTRSLKQSK